MGKLTVFKIRSLTEPGRYCDGDGLYLQTNGKGQASWVLRVQSRGRRRDIGLGSAKWISLKDARIAAFETRKKIAQGIDPVAERKREQLRIPTFRKAAEMVCEEYRKAWKNDKHQSQWISTLKTYAFPRLGDRLVSDIEGPLIREVLAPIWLTKPETARRLRQRIGTVLDWSYTRGFRATEAPMRSLSRGLPRQPKRDKHFAALPYQQIPGFLWKLAERETVARLALEALILTAGRSSEIRGATWSELDLAAAKWIVPAERMKMGRAHVVPLSPEAVEAFERAKRFRVGASDLVFPGQNVKKPISATTLLKILSDMDLGITVHGFRSAFRDWVAEQTDYSGEIAEAALAHSVSNKVEAAYRRTDFFEKRRLLMRDWAIFCKTTRRPANDDRASPDQRECPDILA